MNIQLLNSAKTGDDRARNYFIESNKAFIYKYACSVCKRKLNWENDDELSIALMAFNSAIDSFQEGEFEFYSKMLIKHRLIDYFRKNSRNDTPIEDAVLYSIVQYDGQMEEKLDRALQINIFKEVLKDFNISMETLVSSSPKHRDTRDKLIALAREISLNKGILEQLFYRNLLPIKDILNICNVSRKTIEEWRKYLIALIIIFSDKRLDAIRDFIL